MTQKIESLKDDLETVQSETENEQEMFDIKSKTSIEPNQNYIKLYFADKYGILFNGKFSLINKKLDLFLGKKITIEERKGALHLILDNGEVVLGKNGKIIAIYEN